MWNNIFGETDPKLICVIKLKQVSTLFLDLNLFFHKILSIISQIYQGPPGLQLLWCFLMISSQTCIQNLVDQWGEGSDLYFYKFPKLWMFSLETAVFIMMPNTWHACLHLLMHIRWRANIKPPNNTQHSANQVDACLAKKSSHSWNFSKNSTLIQYYL